MGVQHPVTPASSAPTTISTSNASLLTVKTLATTTGVNTRDLAIITAVTSLADKKVVGNMKISTGKIVMQSRGLDLVNAMVNIFSLDPLKEEYHLLLASPVIVPMFIQRGLDVMKLQI